MKKQANWMGWTLHAVVGAIVGSVLAWRWRVHGDWEFILGGALIVAGLASLVGDAIYKGESYRMVPPSEREHSGISLAMSGVLMLIGVVLLVKCLL